MECAFVAALGKAREIVKEVDPGAPASISGTQIPTAHNGANWYEIAQIMDYLQPYSGRRPGWHAPSGQPLAAAAQAAVAR